jgi:hypothetical protein
VWHERVAADYTAGPAASWARSLAAAPAEAPAGAPGDQCVAAEAVPQARPTARLELIGSAVRQGQLLACVVCRRHRKHAQQVAERGPAQAAQQHATRRHLEWLGDAQRDGDAGESLERHHEGTDSGARPAGQRLQHQARAEDEVGQRDQPKDVGIVRPVFRGW